MISSNRVIYKTRPLRYQPLPPAPHLPSSSLPTLPLSRSSSGHCADTSPTLQSPRGPAQMLIVFMPSWGQRESL